MSELIDDKITIYEAMQNIKKEKYVIPAFQRQFLWDMERIEKLWDSILLDYPISHFLFWHLDDSNVSWDTYFLQFLSKITFSSKFTAKGESNNYSSSSIDVSKNDTAILDGQQRLTALFISLYGDIYLREKHQRKKNEGGIVCKLFIELNKNSFKNEDEEINNKKYDVKFTTKIGLVSPTLFEIRTILDEKYQNEESRKKEFEKIVSKVPENSREYALTLLNKLYSKIFEEKIIKYTDIYDMKEEDALEMFVRFNSGGVVLSKSDITFSLIEAYWAQSRDEFGKILKGKYSNFHIDFLVRTSLMLYGDVVKSNISKNVVDDLKKNWNDFKMALRNTESLLDSLNIDIDRFSKSWNALLPIIYFVYYNPSDYLDNINDVRAYLVRSILFRYYQSGTTGKLQQMKKGINEFNCKITVEMLEQISGLTVTSAKIEDILNSEKDSRIAKETLYFLSKDWLKPNLKYEQDHLHPCDRFNESKPFNVSFDKWNKWKTIRNRLPNLWLLEGSSNASKSNMRLIDYYNEKTDEQKKEFITQAMLPNVEDVSYEIENFEEFYNERSKILRDKIWNLLW